jgi:hypothetical protein
MPKFNAMSWLPVPLFSAVEHVAGAGGAGALEVLAADHVTCSGVLEDIGLLGGAQPVADDCRGVQLHGQGGCLAGSRCMAGTRNSFQAVGIAAHAARLQAGALEQRRQALFCTIGTVEATTLHATGHWRTERKQQAGLAAELVQRRLQARWRYVVSTGRRIGGAGRSQRGEAQAGAEQQAAQGVGKRGQGGGHARAFEKRIERSLPLCHANPGKRLTRR